ncbi:MAG: DUF962 domain-containing protein [Planctomycetota bacterium]|nr:DUF962 domain-containing protein [Planctomycetota bacterium]MDP6762241.1 DUF962 domain-containing protein [Planctomycetota bacterium]MDP6989342.1 DUF962 domain-containing protein [Planctomycetota bacterium]
MKPQVVRLMHEYAECHRHPVNLTIHKLAIPLIVFHVIAMLDWVSLGGWTTAGGLEVTLAWPLVGLSGLWYLWGAPRLAPYAIAHALSCLVLAQLTPVWLVIAVAVAAWTVQLLGHAVWEGRSPAFLRNLVQLLVGPLFVVAHLTGNWPPAEETPSPGSS